MTTRQTPRAPLFDLRDAVFFGGLAVAAGGGAMLSVPWTLIILGALLALKAHGPLITVTRRSAE